MPYVVIGHPKEDLNRSLGKLAYWWIRNFLVYGPGSVAGQPVRLGPERTSELVRMYALDENGRRLYNSVFMSKCKGYDKSGFGGYIACFEALGPSRFAGWAQGGEKYKYLGKTYVYSPGEPMGRPVVSPIIRCIATEEDQSGNVYDNILDNFRDGPLSELGLAAFDGYIDLGNGGKVLPSTSGAASKDGGKETFIVCDEALALDTPIPVPVYRRKYGPMDIGWTTVADINVGDTVLDRYGDPVLVIKKTDIMEDRKCYRLRFSRIEPRRIVEDADIVASEGHLWAVYETTGVGSSLLIQPTEKEMTTGAIAVALGRAKETGAPFGVAIRDGYGDYFIVESIDPVESVPVACIAVASEEHVFLAGHGMVPTHNTHLWTTPRLKAAYTTLKRNLTKRPSEQPWLLETTTMYEPGAMSIAEETYTFAEQIREGKAKRPNLLFLHRYGLLKEDDIADESMLRAALEDAMGEAGEWLSVEDRVTAIYDPREDVRDSIRYYLNALAGSATAWLTPAVIDNVVTDETLQPGDEIALGFDGALTSDATALVAVRLSDNLIQLLHLQECPPGADGKIWSVDQGAVDAAVASAFNDFKVKAFFADPPYWQEYIDAWAKEWGSQLAPARASHPISFWTSNENQMVHAVERAKTLFLSGGVKVNRHPALIRHLQNARVGKKRSGELIYKEMKGSPKKIDAAVSTVLALNAASAARAFVPKERKSTKDPYAGLVADVPASLFIPNYGGNTSWRR